MDTASLLSASLILRGDSNNRQSLQFLVGHRLLGRVLATVPDEKLLHLEIKGKPVRAHSSLSVSVGETLKLEVIRGGSAPVLKVISAATKDPVADALKHYLPKQQDFSTLASHLLRAAGSGTRAAAIPAPLKGPIETLLQKLPDLASLTDPTRLASAVRRSGVFFEAHLATQPQAVAETDLKASLLRFLNAVAKAATTPVPTATHQKPMQHTPAPEPAPGSGGKPAAPLADNATTAAPQDTVRKTPMAEGDRALPRADPENRPLPAPPRNEAFLRTPVEKTVPIQANAKPTPPDSDVDIPVPAAPQKIPKAHAANASLEADIDPLLIETLKKTGEGALAKLVLDQLASLPKQQSGEQTWQLTLPFLHEQQPHTVRLTVSGRPESENTAGKDPRWSVEIELHPPHLGTIRCRLSLQDASVDTRFWCDQQATASLLSGNLETLRLRYQEAGLVPGQLESSPGLPDRPAPQWSADSAYKLLDERA